MSLSGVPLAVAPSQRETNLALANEAVRRGVNRYSLDRYGRKVLAFNRDGKPYEACPMCGLKASVRTELEADTIWDCEACGYRDSDKLGPLN